MDVIKMYSEINNSKTSDDFIKKFSKYGTFAANIANAKNSDDIENAIEAIALPSGSSQIKRQSAFNIDLNAYLGLFGSGNYIGGNQNQMSSVMVLPFL